MKKFFLYVLTFIVVAVATAFGTVTTSSLLIMRSNGGNDSSISTPDAGTHEETDCEKLLNGLLSMGGANINVQFDLENAKEEVEEETKVSVNEENGEVETVSSIISNEENDKISVTFSGKLSLKSLENISIAGTLSVAMYQKNIVVDIAYYNGMIYVKNESMSIKIATDSLMKITELLPIFGIEIDLGGGIEDISMDALLGMFQDLKAEELESGDLLFPIKITDDIALSLVTDADYILKSVTADKIKFEGKVATVSVGVEKDSELEITDPEVETPYVDVTRTLGLIDNVKEILTEKKIRLDIACNLTGKIAGEVKGTVNLDFSQGFVLYVDANVTALQKTYPLSVYYENNDAYVCFNGKKIAFTKDKIDELVTFVKDLTKGNDESNVISQMFSKIDLSKYENIDFSKIDINNFLKFKDGENGEIIVTILGKDLRIQDITLSILLDEAGGLKSVTLDEIKIFDNTLQANIEYSSACYIPEIDKNEYIVLEDLPAFLNATISTISDILGQKYVSAGIELNVKMSDLDLSINGLATVDFSDSLKVYLKAEVFFKNKLFSVNACLAGDEIFVTCENLKFRATISDIADVISAIEPFTSDYSTYSTLKNVEKLLRKATVKKDLMQIIKGLPQVILTNLYCRTNEVGLTINGALLHINEDVDVKINYDEKLSKFSIQDIDLSGIKLDATLSLMDEKFTFDTTGSDYISLKGTDKLVRAVIMTVRGFKERRYLALNIDGTFNMEGVDLDVQGEVLYRSSKIYANLSGVLNERLPFDAYYIDGVIYANVQGLKVKLPLSLVKDLIQKYAGDVDIKGVLKDILPNYDFEKILSGDLSGLTFNILKNLTISNNSITILVNGDEISSASDVELIVGFDRRITSISVRGVDIKGYKLDANATVLGEIVVPEMTDDYVDLSSVPALVEAVKKTVNEITTNKQIAFDLKTDLVYTQVTYDSLNKPTKTTETIVTLSKGSKAKFDWSDAILEIDGVKQFDAKNLKAYVNFEAVTVTNKYTGGGVSRGTTATSSVTNNHSIEITYLDNTVYIRYNKMFVKIGGDNIKQIVGWVMDLLGVESDENVDIDISKLFNSSIDLSKFSLDMLKEFVLSDSHFGATADLSKLNVKDCNLSDIKIGVDYSENGLSNLVLQDFKLKNIDVSKIDISLGNFEQISGAPQGNYIDLSSVDELLKAVINMKDFKDFEVQGSVKLKINLFKLNWDVPVTVKVKLLGDGDFEASAKIGAIPVVAGVNDDVPYKFGNTISGASPGKNRILDIYIKNNMAYIYRSEKIPVFLSSDKTYEKKMKVHLDTLLDDPLYYLLQYGFGFNDTIMDAIYESLNKEKDPIDYSNVLKGFSSSSNYFCLTLNLKELAQNDKLDTMTLGLRTSNYNNQKIVSGITLDMFMPVANGVEITLQSDNLNLINIGQETNMSSLNAFVNSNSSLKEGASWDAYNGDWNLSAQRQFTLYFDTKCDQKANEITGVAGTEITLPTLSNFYKDSESERTYYTFAGWFTSESCDTDTEYKESIMPRKDTMLYAKWNTVSRAYATLSFVSKYGEEKESLTALEGEKITLPVFLEDVYEEVGFNSFTKRFEGWFLDEEFTIKFEETTMPSENTTLYAYWKVIDCTRKYVLSIYDDGEIIESLRVPENEIPQLIGEKFIESTLYYLDENWTERVDITTFKMPSADENLYIRNKYKATIVSNYGTTLNETIELYQGDPITLQSQQNYEFDTYANGQKSKRYYYTFNGYKNETTGALIDGLSTTMPNCDSQIVAQWTEVVKNYYTLTFSKENNAGNPAYNKYISFPIESLVVLEGETVNLSQYVPVWEYTTGSGRFKVTWHYKFNGWSTAKDGSTISEITVKENTTIYAKWKYAGKK